MQNYIVICTEELIFKAEVSFLWCLYFQNFSNMKSWRAHWDRQLYKALEHQYQVGLEALNEHLPEIKVELVYRWVDCQLFPLSISNQHIN
jgi:hypothetical protein